MASTGLIQQQLLSYQRKLFSSSYYNSISYLTTIRQLSNKKTISQSDITKLIQLIQTFHITTLYHLSNFFQHLKNQLLLTDYYYKQSTLANPNFKEENKHKSIKFTPYFNQSQPFDKQIFIKLYDVLSKKINFYKKQLISQYHKIQSSRYTATQNKKNNLPSSYHLSILNKLYPSTYQLYKTLKCELSFLQFVQATKKVQQVQGQVQIFSKDKLVKQAQTYSVLHLKNENQSQKSSKLLKELSLLRDQQFFDIKQFLQKIKFQVTLFSSKGGFFKYFNQQNFKSISTKCIGCAPFVYEAQPLSRQRSTITKFQVVKSLNDKQFKRLKYLIEAFMNSPNGGVILFDCEDHLFQVYPKGLQIVSKNLEYKKQSIIDNCKNTFKNFHIDQDYAIDFIMVCDQDNNPVIRKKENNSSSSMSKKKQQNKDNENDNDKNTNYYVGRFKIFSNKSNRFLRVYDQLQQNKNQINQKNVKVISSQIGNIGIKNVTYEQMKKMFYRQKLIIKDLNLPGRKQKIAHAFENEKQNQDQLMQSILRGRLSPLIHHQTKQCKPPQQLVRRIAQNNKKNNNKNVTQDKRNINLHSEDQSISTQISTKSTKFSKDYANWTLLIVNVENKQTVQKQISILFDHHNFIVQIPFQYQKRFSQSRQTLLVRSQFKQDHLVQKMRSKTAQENVYLRVYSKQGYKPLTYIKVYPYVCVSYKYKRFSKELIKIRDHLEQQLKNYIKKQPSQLNDNNNLDNKVTLSYSVQRDCIYIEIGKSQLSYKLLYQTSNKIDRSILKVQFKPNIPDNAINIDEDNQQQQQKNNSTKSNSNQYGDQSNINIKNYLSFKSQFSHK